MQVILAAPRVPGPCRAAENRLPVRRRGAIGLGIGPDVPVGLGIIAARPALLEPCMLVRCMRIDLVDQDLEAKFVRAGYQSVEIGQIAEYGIDVTIVRHVITEILHRRLEEGRNPDRIHAELGDMRQALRDAGQIADPVAVRIHEAARIDLVDRRALPPWQVGNVGLPAHSARSDTRHTAQPKAGRVKAALPGAVGAEGQLPASVSKALAP